MDPRVKKQISIGALAVLVLAAIVYGFWPKPVPVEAGEVERQPMQVTFEEEGKTQVQDRFVISAPVAGLIQRIELQAGDEVSEGETLVRILPVAPELLNERQFSMAQARLKSSRVALQQAREQLRLAADEADYWEKEYARIKKLHDSGVGSDQVIEESLLALQRARSARVSAEFGVNIAEYEVESAEAVLQYARESEVTDEILTVQSPVKGVVFSVPNQSEHPVQPGEPLMEVGNPRSLEIRADVLSSDAVMIRPAMRVMIRRWGGEEQLEGRVRRVEPAAYTKVSALGVEEQRVPVIIDITSPREEWLRLGDGYRVVAEFVSWQGQEVLQVPTSALFRSGNEWAVFLVNSEHVRRKTIKIGHQSGLFTEILGGLSEGQLVLTHPDERIEDGVRIQVRD